MMMGATVWSSIMKHIWYYPCMVINIFLFISTKKPELEVRADGSMIDRLMRLRPLSVDEMDE